jgi:hypothetical protein
VADVNDLNVDVYYEKVLALAEQLPIDEKLQLISVVALRLREKILEARKQPGSKQNLSEEELTNDK